MSADRRGLFENDLGVGRISTLVRGGGRTSDALELFEEEA